MPGLDTSIEAPARDGIGWKLEDKTHIPVAPVTIILGSVVREPLCMYQALSIFLTVYMLLISMIRGMSGMKLDPDHKLYPSRKFFSHTRRVMLLSLLQKDWWQHVYFVFGWRICEAMIVRGGV